jgi:flavin-dependent dehydrogenase
MNKVRHIDNLVIGAGPAGSVFGYLALKAGLNCLLVDFATFPRDKICGGGLTPKAWRLLDKLMPGIKYDYHPVRHMRFQLDDSPSCEFESEFEIRMTSRKDFDYTLLQYYQQAGGELLKDAFVSFEQQPDGRFLVTMRSGLQLTCNYLIAADGANSRVRRQLLGKPKDQMLFMEEYVPKQGPEEAFVFFSRRFIPGGFYKFSSIGRDIYGYRAPETNRETFRQMLKEFNIPETKLVGANISLHTVQSPIPNIILIGDAGGFANKITGEGLYDAFKTAYNARRAIVEHKPFCETNRQVFRKMKAEERAARFFFSPTGIKFLSFCIHHPRFTKWIFDAKMKRETFLRLR